MGSTGSTYRIRAPRKPDSDVIELLRRVLSSALEGNVRTISIVAVNPLHQVDDEAAGDLSELRTTVLVAGLARAQHKLLSTQLAAATPP